MDPLAPPDLEPLTRLTVRVGPPVDVGDTSQGRRRIVPILGGSADGPGLQGTILAGGADVQRGRADGVTEIAARYAIETPRGTRVFVENTGVRHAPADVMAALARGERVDPARVYFRSVPRFETDDPALRFLERDLFVATGARFPDHVRIDVFRVR